MKNLIGPILILIGLLLWLCGCATMTGSAKSISVGVQIDPNKLDCYVVSVDANDVQVEFATLGRDVKVGGQFISTVSKEDVGILEAIGGFIVGIFVR